MSTENLVQQHENGTVQQQIDALNAKMDRILEELAWQRQKRKAYEDLQDDLIKVGNDAMKSAMDQLERYSETINSEEISSLAWNLARNLQNLNKLVGQMESGMAFMEDAAPIMRQGIIDLTRHLDEWDRKGYFSTIQALTEEAGAIAQVLDKHQIHAAGKKLRQALEDVAAHAPDRKDEASLLRLARELRTPEVKRSLSILLLILKDLGRQAEPNSNDKTNTQ